MLLGRPRWESRHDHVSQHKLSSNVALLDLQKGYDMSQHLLVALCQIDLCRHAPPCTSSRRVAYEICVRDGPSKNREIVTPEPVGALFVCTNKQKPPPRLNQETPYSSTAHGLCGRALIWAPMLQPTHTALVYRLCGNRSPHDVRSCIYFPS